MDENSFLNLTTNKTMELFPEDPIEELFAEIRRLLKRANFLISEMKKL